MEAPRNGTIIISFILVLIAVTTMQTHCMASSTANNVNATKTETYTSFIKTQCKTATYPSVCTKALTSYASKVKTDPQSLCYAAMSVAAQAARNASATVKKLMKRKGLSETDRSTVADCVDELGDTVDELEESLAALGSIREAKGSNVEFQIDNVKTWASAAMTNEYTCTDELNEEGASASVKKKISKTMVNLARHTSNALCLINRLTY